MLVKLINLDYSVFTVIEFWSGDIVYKMETFWKQIPSQIISLKPEESFEVPNEFMCKGLKISITENPVREYIENYEACIKIRDKGERNEVRNAIFENFMDTLAKFCNYDRRGEMIRWQDANDHCM